MNDVIDDFRETTDMNLAAAFMACGGKLNLDLTDHTDPRHVKFHITGNSEKLIEIEDQWYEKVLMVNVRKFVTELQDLRNVIRG